MVDKPRPLSMVEDNGDFGKDPEWPGPLIFLGEIPNMPGHCVVIEIVSKELHIGYHTDRFEELPEDET